MAGGVIETVLAICIGRPTVVSMDAVVASADIACRKVLGGEFADSEAGSVISLSEKP